MKKLRRLVIALLLLTMTMPTLVMADSAEDDRIVVLGKNLNDGQRKEMLKQFNISGDLKVIEVTNQEERKYLGKYIDEKHLGTRAISSAYVERLKEGEGLEVEVNNITWVTEDMYRNALLTAGVKDARVKISSPVKVSGTAALTGIIKAFEEVSGTVISEVSKDAASEEIVTTATLGNQIGKEEAEDLISSVKMYIVENDIKNKGSIKEVVNDMSNELNIKLTPEQEAQVVDLMKKISSLDINVDSIKTQIGDIAKKLENITSQNEEVKGILQKILDAITNFFNRIFG